MLSPVFQELTHLLSERIVIFDGGMGTMLQKYQFKETDFCGEVFKDSPLPLKGNNDLLCLSQPQAVEEIHYAYAKAGADILVTNTLCAQSTTQSTYGTQHLVGRINLAAVSICRRAAERAGKESGRKIFVAGSIGPMNFMLSAPNNVITYEDVVASYVEQVQALLDGGVDVLLIETIVDLINAKAAMSAIKAVFDGKEYEKVPVMASVTLTNDGKLISGETLADFCVSFSNDSLFAVGINCSFGPSSISSAVKELSEVWDGYVLCYPNSGVPDSQDDSSRLTDPIEFSSVLNSWSLNQWVNIVGGCCGTTPEYVSAIQHAVKGVGPRKITLSSRK